MRIISQDGFYDVPYEAIAIRFHEDDSTIILGVPLSVISMDLVSDVPLITLGEYSTEAKAQKAMEMLREAYAYERFFKFPADKDVNGAEMKSNKSFGEKVLNILKYKGISQRELAEKVGCTEVSMSRYISGERVPKAPIVVKIADVLGVTVEYLVSDSIE